MDNQIQVLERNTDGSSDLGCLFMCSSIICVLIFVMIFAAVWIKLYGIGGGAILVTISAQLVMIIAYDPDKVTVPMYRHIHKTSCTWSRRAYVIEQTTKSKLVPGPFNGPAIVSSEIECVRTLCTECGTVTVWERGKPRYLES